MRKRKKFRWKNVRKLLCCCFPIGKRAAANDLNDPNSLDDEQYSCFTESGLRSVDVTLLDSIRALCQEEIVVEAREDAYCPRQWVPRRKTVELSIHTIHPEAVLVFNAKSILVPRPFWTFPMEHSHEIPDYLVMWPRNDCRKVSLFNGMLPSAVYTSLVLWHQYNNLTSFLQSQAQECRYSTELCISPLVVLYNFIRILHQIDDAKDVRVTIVDNQAILEISIIASPTHPELFKAIYGRVWSSTNTVAHPLVHGMNGQNRVDVADLDIREDCYGGIHVNARAYPVAVEQSVVRKFRMPRFTVRRFAMHRSRPIQRSALHRSFMRRSIRPSSDIRDTSLAIPLPNTGIDLHDDVISGYCIGYDFDTDLDSQDHITNLSIVEPSIDVMNIVIDNIKNQQMTNEMFNIMINIQEINVFNADISSGNILKAPPVDQTNDVTSHVDVLDTINAIPIPNTGHDLYDDVTSSHHLGDDIFNDLDSQDRITDLGNPETSGVIANVMNNIIDTIENQEMTNSLINFMNNIIDKIEMLDMSVANTFNDIIDNYSGSDNIANVNKMDTDINNKDKDDGHVHGIIGHTETTLASHSLSSLTPNGPNSDVRCPDKIRPDGRDPLIKTHPKAMLQAASDPPPQVDQMSDMTSQVDTLDTNIDIPPPDTGTDLHHDDTTDENIGSDSISKTDSKGKDDGHVYGTVGHTESTLTAHTLSSLTSSSDVKCSDKILPVGRDPLTKIHPKAMLQAASDPPPQVDQMSDMTSRVDTLDTNIDIPLPDNGTDLYPNDTIDENIGSNSISKTDSKGKDDGHVHSTIGHTESTLASHSLSSLTLHNPNSDDRCSDKILPARRDPLTKIHPKAMLQAASDPPPQVDQKNSMFPLEVTYVQALTDASINKKDQGDMFGYTPGTDERDKPPCYTSAEMTPFFLSRVKCPQITQTVPSTAIHHSTAVCICGLAFAMVMDPGRWTENKLCLLITNAAGVKAAIIQNIKKGNIDMCKLPEQVNTRFKTLPSGPPSAWLGTKHVLSSSDVTCSNPSPHSRSASSHLLSSMRLALKLCHTIGAVLSNGDSVVHAVMRTRTNQVALLSSSGEEVAVCMFEDLSGCITYLHSKFSESMTFQILPVYKYASCLEHILPAHPSITEICPEISS